MVVEECSSSHFHGCTLQMRAFLGICNIHANRHANRQSPPANAPSGTAVTLNSDCYIHYRRIIPVHTRFNIAIKCGRCVSHLAIFGSICSIDVCSAPGRTHGSFTELANFLQLQLPVAAPISPSARRCYAQLAACYAVLLLLMKCMASSCQV